LFDPLLLFDQHISNVVSKAYSVQRAYSCNGTFENYPGTVLSLCISPC